MRHHKNGVWPEALGPGQPWMPEILLESLHAQHVLRAEQHSHMPQRAELTRQKLSTHLCCETHLSTANAFKYLCRWLDDLLLLLAQPMHEAILKSPLSLLAWRVMQRNVIEAKRAMSVQ